MNVSTITLNDKYNVGKKTARAKEVSKMYGIGISTVWALAKAGKITPIKISPRVTLFSIKELDAFFGIDEVA